MSLLKYKSMNFFSAFTTFLRGNESPIPKKGEFSRSETNVHSILHFQSCGLLYNI
jgi:hypothetical protein